MQGWGKQCVETLVNFQGKQLSGRRNVLSFQSNKRTAEGFDEKKYAFNLAQTTQEQKLFFLQCISEGRQKIQNSDIFRDAFLSCGNACLEAIKNQKAVSAKIMLSGCLKGWV